MDDAKRCSSCGQTLPSECFYRIKNRGLSSRCKDCEKAYQAEWRARNREHINARARHWRADHRETLAARREANRETLRAYQRQWYENNREDWRAYQRHWYAAHRATYRERRRRWYAENREEHNERSRRHYDANKESYHARTRAWERSHPERQAETQRRRRARKLGTSVASITPELLDAKLAYWGWTCWMCGGEPKAWDHVKPLSKGGAHMLANLRPACRSCNSVKGSRWAGVTRLAAA